MSAAEVFSWIGGALVVIGGVFMVIGALGLVRMPDVFTRVHAASVTDTFGVSIILIGLVLIAGFSLVSVKLVLLILFLALTGPTATHAIARAALHADLKPVDRDGKPLRGIEEAKEEDVPSKP